MKIISTEIPRLVMKDYSQFSKGATTKQLLNSDASLNSALNIFTSTNLKDGKNKLAMFMPGLVVSSRTTFENQIAFFGSNGFDTVWIDYSNEAHSQTLLRAQTTDFLNRPEIRNKTVTLVGMSLGAGTIIDLLMEEGTDKIPNVTNIVLLGTVYSDEDIKTGIFGKALGLANKLTPESVSGKLAPLAKRIFRLDPLHGEEVREEIYETTNEALIGRIKTINTARPIDQTNKFPNIHALFGWWEEDYASLQARIRLESLFTNKNDFIIPGRHAWMKTGSEAINSAIFKSIENCY